jgi:hypothetical protein
MQETPSLLPARGSVAEHQGDHGRAVTFYEAALVSGKMLYSSALYRMIMRHR